MGTKVTNIREQKLKKPRKQKFKNLGTKATKISKIWEQKFQNLGKKVKKIQEQNPGTHISKNPRTKI
jgi:hypothetical protein